MKLCELVINSMEGSLYLTWPEVAIGLQSWWSGEKMNMYIVGRAKTY